MQPYCPLCGFALDRRLFTGGYRKGVAFDVAHISVECPQCQTQVNITQGLRSHDQQAALDRVKALKTRLDEIESEPGVIDGEVIDVIEVDIEDQKEIEQ